MPWCDECDRYLNPNTVENDGTCPSCGAQVTSTSQLRRARRGRGSGADAMAVRADPAEESEDEAEQSRAPWHFWVLVVALVIYLGWRLFQGIVWLAHKL